jgi:hypothetical protein
MITLVYHITVDAPWLGEKGRAISRMQMVAMGGTADICIRLHQLLLLPLQEVKANGPNNIRIDVLSVQKD